MSSISGGAGSVRYVLALGMESVGKSMLILQMRSTFAAAAAAAAAAGHVLKPLRRDVAVHAYCAAVPARKCHLSHAANSCPPISLLTLPPPTRRQVPG
jgi:nicotinamide riboside kinase